MKMATYTKAFEDAISHAMLYEVGGFWNVNHPAVARGLVDSMANRKAVGYVNDPKDRGGETKFGVSKRANPDLDIRNLTWEQAKTVYYIRYWLAAKCERLPARVAVLHFDGAVNHGIARANTFLQRAVNVATDGIIGPITLAKIANVDAIVLNHSVCHQREEFYRWIVANNPPQARFLAGWLRRISEMRTYTTDIRRTFS